MTIPTLTPPAAASTQVKAVGHADGALFIQFHGSSGIVYRYDGAPAELAEGIRSAESPGKYFNQHVRMRFPHEKLALAEQT